MFRRFLLLTLLALICHSAAYAQNLSKRFVSKPTENGMLYFIKPQEMPLKGSSQLVTKPMLYDITLRSKNDSVAFCLTIYTKEPVELQTVQVNTHDGMITSQPLEKIYVGIEKKHFKGRYRFYTTKQQIESMYGSATPFEVDFGKGIIFSNAKGKWAKESNAYKTILQLASMN